MPGVMCSECARYVEWRCGAYRCPTIWLGGKPYCSLSCADKARGDKSQAAAVENELGTDA